jgi:hypothetical protein
MISDDSDTTSARHFRFPLSAFRFLDFSFCLQPVPPPPQKYKKVRELALPNLAKMID